MSRENEMNWTTEKPDFACVFVARQLGSGNYDYSLWQFSWELGEPPEDGATGDDGYTQYYYLAWTDNDGDEYDNIDECNFDEYLVLARLPDIDGHQPAQAKDQTDTPEVSKETE